jgi:hypothetical protein
MAEQGVMIEKPLIESDRVAGTTVYDPQGHSIGSIKRLMIEKLSRRHAGGFDSGRVRGTAARRP